MGDYYLNYKDSNPNSSAWFTANVSYYYNNGATYYATKLLDKTTYDMSKMKDELNKNKPVISSGKNTKGTQHMALVVAYVGSCNL